MRSPTRVWCVCVGQSAFVSVPKMNGSPRAEYKDDTIKTLKTAVLIWFQWKNIRFDYGILCFQINKRWNINWNDSSISSDWPNLCPTVDIYRSTWSGCQSWEWPQTAPLKKGAGSTDLAPCLTDWQIDLSGDKQTVKYMATLSDMATLAVHKPWAESRAS